MIDDDDRTTVNPKSFRIQSTLHHQNSLVKKKKKKGNNYNRNNSDNVHLGTYQRRYYHYVFSYCIQTPVVRTWAASPNTA